MAAIQLSIRSVDCESITSLFGRVFTMTLLSLSKLSGSHVMFQRWSHSFHYARYDVRLFFKVGMNICIKSLYLTSMKPLMGYFLSAIRLCQGLFLRKLQAIFFAEHLWTIASKWNGTTFFQYSTGCVFMSDSFLDHLDEPNQHLKLQLICINILPLTSPYLICIIVPHLNARSQNID